MRSHRAAFPHVRASLALLLLLAWLALPGAASAEPRAVAGEPPAQVRSVFVRVPYGAQPGRPLRVLVAVHGMGGSGEPFARDLFEQADREQWLIVAPTFEYGDWRDPAQVAREDPALIRWLADYTARLKVTTGWSVKSRLFLLGHSRGAQLVQRFAFVYPERSLAVAALSAGTYTLPVSRSERWGTLAFPYGVGDLNARTGRVFNRVLAESVHYWVGVGADDTNPADLPRQWDPYIGTTRVQRARSFQAAMRSFGAETTLQVFRGAGHGLTSQMRKDACSFFKRTALEVANLLAYELPRGRGAIAI